MKRLVGAALTLALWAGAGTASALPALSTQELKTLCAQSADVIPDTCSYYLRGFLDGAIATDPQVVRNVARELESASLSERAYRTRLGPRLEHYGAAYYADLCVDESVSLADLRQAVTRALESGDVLPDAAREFVYQVLQQQFPCRD